MSSRLEEFRDHRKRLLSKRHRLLEKKRKIEDKFLLIGVVDLIVDKLEYGKYIGAPVKPWKELVSSVPGYATPNTRLEVGANLLEVESELRYLGVRFKTEREYQDLIDTIMDKKGEVSAGGKEYIVDRLIDEHVERLTEDIARDPISSPPEKIDDYVERPDQKTA